MDLDLSPELIMGLIALLVATYGLVATKLGRISISAAFAFMLIGAIIGWLGIGLFPGDVPVTTALSLLAEITLALVLFSAASTVRLKRLEVDSPLVARLLFIGLPLTIALGTVMALGLFPGISFGLALLIATILAPTDADLGHQVITDTSVPARVRRMLNIESGLNDGIAAPIVTVAIALAAFGDVGDMNPVFDAIFELGVALIIGVVIGVIGRQGLVLADRHHLASLDSLRLATLALALAAYFVAAGLGASGFIAAFAAGLAFGMGSKARVEKAIRFTENQSVLLSILVWLTFGLLIFGDFVVGLSDPMVIVYAVLSLTLMRMVPVAIALWGSRFDRVSVAFIGWFGPRGLASVVFVILGLEALESAGVPSDPLGAVVAWTVFLSVIAHGFSARPLAAWYGRFANGLADGSPEFIGEEEPQHARWAFHGHRMDEARSTEEAD
jgi:NhaP-type Na+/H+ or K+/H+ antiporter